MPASPAALTSGLPRIVVVTGTDTGVGKTITTAALAAALTSPAWGRRTVAAYKPVQTGIGNGEPGDSDEVRRLAGLAAVSDGARLRAPMAPAAAAELEDTRLPDLNVHVERVSELAAANDHVLIEGAGGLLVELDSAGHTLADLAAALSGGAGNPSGTRSGPRSALTVGVIVVARSGLGTLNHCLLTLEALDRRGLEVSGVVIGAWPQQPNQIETSNTEYLRGLSTPLAGVIPAGAAALDPRRFRSLAPQWLNGLVSVP
jgi:dethiobiotin synthetase